MCALCALALGAIQRSIVKTSVSSRPSSGNFVPFARVERLKPSEANNMQRAYDLDTSPKKISLAGDMFRNNEGKSEIFQVVRKAQIAVASNESYIHEPLPVLGNPEFVQAANELILNKAAPAISQNRVLGVQTRSGMDALNLAAHFLRRKMRCNVCMVAMPSCEYCEQVFRNAGFCCQSYQYYSRDKGELNIYGLVADLMTAPEGSVVLLDACAHNPTGLDPSIDEWKLIAHIIKCKQLLPVFHLEAHGLVSGDITQDCWPVRYFVDNGFDLLCAQSFVQNFGLYDETLGHLMIVVKNSVQREVVREQLEAMLNISMEHGSSVFASRIVASILRNESLRKEWTITLQDIHHRLQQMRSALSNKLDVLKTPGCWGHLKEQGGQHLYTNLKAKQLKDLRHKHVYVPDTGRINLGALNTSNVDFVANAICDVMLREEAGIFPKDPLREHMDALQGYYSSIIDVANI